MSQAADTYSSWVLQHDGLGSAAAAHVAAWVAFLVGAPMALCAMTMIFLLAPDGRLASRRWWWAAGTSIAGVTLYTAGLLATPPAQFIPSYDAEDHGPVTGTLFELGFPLIQAGLVASVISLTLRLRRAQARVRGQLWWIVSAAALLAGGFLFLAVMGVVQGEQTVLGATPLFAAYLAFPLATAVAVLRHGLFDIELIVNRALVVTLATAVVAAGYVAVVVTLGAFVGAGGFWPSLAATALVAMAFQPLRHRIVRVADRLAFGAAAVPYEALADLSRRLGDSPDPAVLLPAVADAAGTAVGARRVTVRMQVPDGPEQVATWPTGATDSQAPTIEFPVIDRHDVLGTVTVTMPAGRTLRAAEHRLLTDLTDQAATAFRSTRLSAALDQQVHQLNTRTLELAASRRRLISAGDAERSRLERSIAQQVLPHLQPLPTRLDHLAHHQPDQPDGTDQPNDLAPLITATLTALEELREITRGVFPAQLARSGLHPALTSLLARTPHTHLLTDPATTGQRLDPRTEAAAYFCVAELARVLPPPIDVTIATTNHRLHITLTAPTPTSLPLDALRDRLDTVDGAVTTRAVASGTVVQLSVPTGPPVGRPDADRSAGLIGYAPAADHAVASRSGPNADLVT